MKLLHMFNSRLILFFLILLNTLCLVKAQNLVISPECVVYDAASKRYLVSCYNSGRVVAIDSNGNQTYFKTGLSHCLGNTVYNGVFYVSTGKTIKGFDLISAAQVMSINIPDSHQLDGMATDTAGNLYVADFHYQGSDDQIYKINLAANVYSVFVGPGHGLAESPQDLAYDKTNNRLIVANYYNNSPIQSVSLSDSAVTDIVSSSIGNFDGVAQDNDGNFYFTSWGTGCVHKYDKDFVNPPVVVLSGLSGPSNLCYNEVDNVLAVPVFNMDTVIFKQLEPIGLINNSSVLIDFTLHQNYPNPFNPSTNIKVEMKKSGAVKITVFPVNGSTADIIFAGFLPAGVHSFKWNGTDFASGVYLYKIENGKSSDIKKMVLIK